MSKTRTKNKPNSLADEPIAESSHTTTPYGPSSKGICKVSNGNVCGSGSLVGVRNGRSLVLTNAHVAGTRVGKTMKCFFPEVNKTIPCRVIMAGYSDRVMMDWAVLELDREMSSLPHVKLMNERPQGSHYTGGYPRCRGPYYQKLTTTRITHGGTVWRWQPNAIGGQSGSGVHSFDDNLQHGILTWSWGGDGAGQTAHSIWLQYVNRHVGYAFGFERPEGLEELGERAADLENGVFSEANVTTLPIWAHLDDDDDDGPDGPTPNPEFAKRVLKDAAAMQKTAQSLAETARRYMDDTPPDDSGSDDGGGIFGY